MAHPTLSIALATDGVIAMSPEAFEPEAAAAFRKWFEERSTPVHFVGPLIPDGDKAEAQEKSQSPLSKDIQAFLDRQLQMRGENSVLYVRSDLLGSTHSVLTVGSHVDFFWIYILSPPP